MLAIAKLIVVAKNFLYRKMKMLILLTLKKPHLSSMEAFFFCINHRGGCDIFRNFLNMLVNHKTNEAKSGRKNLSSCAKGLVAVRIQLLRNLCGHSAVLERWENAWFI